MSPISVRTTKVTPHHMGSYPKFAKTGMTKGKVSSIMDIESKNMPKMRYRTTRKIIVPYFPKDNPNIYEDIFSVTPKS